MFYIIYKIANLVNHKIYIGAHRTNNLDDGYLGSGDKIKLAIKKYGSNNFIKEILSLHPDETSMYLEENRLVTKEFISSDKNYNSTVGGKKPPDPTGKKNPGVGKYWSQHRRGPRSKESIQKQSETRKKLYREGILEINPPSQKGKKKKIITCDVCGKSGGSVAMKRWHFSNCGKPISKETSEKLSLAMKALGIKPQSRKGKRKQKNDQR